MEGRSGVAHPFRFIGSFEGGEDPPQFPYPFCIQAPRLAFGPIVPERLVPNAPDHACRIAGHRRFVKPCLTDANGERDSNALGSGHIILSEIAIDLFPFGRRRRLSDVGFS